MATRYYDLTVPISESLPVWGGDPKVRLERSRFVDGDNVVHSMRMRLGNHTGTHVDALCHVVDVHRVGEALRTRVRAPDHLMRLIAEKGSVCLDGVSLTVNSLRGNVFELMLIPHTLQRTTLKDLRPGRTSNLEVDVLARYVQRCLTAAP